MVILGVDYGQARTGVAACDREELLAAPVGVIAERDPAALTEKLAALASEKKAEAFVLGLPRNMDGTEGQRAGDCRTLADALEALTGLPVVLRDERLTTVRAHGILNETNTRGKKRKQTVDAVAAVLILEEYLRSRKLRKDGEP